MKIEKLIRELEKEQTHSHFDQDDILIEHNNKLYDFDLGIDVNGYPLICITKEVPNIP